MKKGSKLKGMIMLYLLIVLFLFACASPYDDHIHKGLQNYNKGNYDQAIRYYTDAIMSASSDHRKAIAYSNRCLAYRMKKDWDLAISDCTEALRLNPNQEFAYRDRGFVYLQKDKYGLAIRDLSEAIKLGRENYVYLLWRGFAYKERGDYGLAIKDLTEAIRLNPKSSAAYCLRGDLYTLKDEYGLALKDYNNAIRISPHDVEAYFGRGNMYFKKGDYDSAIKSYKEAIRIDQDHTGAYLNLTELYRKRGEYDLEKQCIDELIRLVPKSSLPYFRRAFFHFRTEDYARAEADWRKAAELSTENKGKAGALENVGLIYLRQKKWGTALAHTDSVNELSEDMAWNWLFREIAAHKMGDTAAASAAWEKWTTLQKADDKEELKNWLPKGLHVYLHSHPESINVPPVLSASQDSSAVSASDEKPPIEKRLMEIAPVPVNVDFGRYYAIVIGNDNYRSLPKLKTAATDAREVTETLQNLYGYEVRCLIDATREQIIAALDEFRRILTARDNLLIYYAGHGWYSEEAKRGYWLPITASRDSTAQWLSNATISDSLASIEARHIIVIADTCYSGTLTRGVKVSSRTPGYIERLLSKKSRTALTSGGIEPVIDSGGGRNHSVFAKAFLNTLRANTGVMDGTQLYSQLRDQVRLAAPQDPQYSNIRFAGHEIGGDFLFVRKRR